jgi:hypothetical protein
MNEPTREHTYPKFELLEKEFLVRMAEVMTRGEEKYGKDNWKRFNESQVADIPRHAFMHVISYMDGDKSEDHLAHAACNLMMRMYFESHITEEKHLHELQVEEFGRSTQETPIITSYGQKLVYLGGPIDGVAQVIPESNWREDVAAELANNCISSYNPLTAFRYCAQSGADQALMSINEAAIRNCGLALFNLLENVTSIGTVYEIDLCKRENIPYVVVTNKHFAYLDQSKVRPSLFDAIAEIKNIVNGY